MIRRLPTPRVHGAWTKDWWVGDPGLTRLFGKAPGIDQAVALAARLQGPEQWTEALRPSNGDPVDPDSVVVLAGQQPVLGGGPLLVAHKAATAVAYARALQPHLDRPVVPVFLIATQDHDTSEVDHLDLIDPLNGHMKRIRCALGPRHETFSRCSWDSEIFKDFQGVLKSFCRSDNRSLIQSLATSPAAEHVAQLMETAFAGTGLQIVEAHRLRGPSSVILNRALAQPSELGARLAEGEARLRSCGFPRSFDPADPRPLVLESRDGRRRRIDVADEMASRRLAENPDDFSPHAALRPIVQAATLPVVAQVCGPSEILYLGQARGLHQLFGVTAPQLVPRLEATRVLPGELETLDQDLQPPASRAPVDKPLANLLGSLDAFRATVSDVDPGVAARVDRFAARATRDAHALAESPEWRGRSGRGEPRLRPRGRFQDAVLGWFPDAFGPHALPTWAEDIIQLSQPFEPPHHVLHALSTETH